QVVYIAACQPTGVEGVLAGFAHVGHGITVHDTPVLVYELAFFRRVFGGGWVHGAAHVYFQEIAPGPVTAQVSVLDAESVGRGFDACGGGPVAEQAAGGPVVRVDDRG